MTLRARHSICAFSAADLVSGAPVNYHDDVWQHRVLVLAIVGPEDTWRAWADQLRAHAELQHARLIVTTDRIDGASPFTVVVADQWGEIYWVREGTGSALPSTDEVVDWVGYVRQECPECQGETR